MQTFMPDSFPLFSPPNQDNLVLLYIKWLKENYLNMKLAMRQKPIIKHT